MAVTGVVVGAVGTVGCVPGAWLGAGAPASAEVVEEPAAFWSDVSCGAALMGAAAVALVAVDRIGKGAGLFGLRDRFPTTSFRGSGIHLCPFRPLPGVPLVGVPSPESSPLVELTVI